MGVRRWFHRDATPGEDSTDRVDMVLTSYQTEMAERLEQGLKDIQERTSALIRDIALEVWRSGEDDDLQERVLAVLTRDTALRGLIAHADERYQALDIRIGGLQDRLQSITDLTHELRAFIAEGEGALDTGSVDGRTSDRLRARIDALQQYLGSVLEYEKERDRAISDWLQRMFTRGQEVLREEAGRVISEIRSDVEGESAIAAEQILARLDEQTRAIGYDLSMQEARIRLTLAEGAEDQSGLLRAQIRALDAIEDDLTNGLDARLERIVDLTGDAARSAVEDAAARAGDRSVEAMNVGVQDLLAVIDRRFAWLEESIRERITELERSLGIEEEIITLPAT